MNNYLISYKTQRKIIGILGSALPILIFLGAGFRDTISAYYFTNMQDIFVGILISTGVFLLSYKGYSLIDHILTSIAGFSALLIALFPVNYLSGYEYSFLMISGEASGIIHNFASSVFFILLAVISFFLFTKYSGIITKRKKLRNKIYKICSYILIGGIVILGFVNITKVNIGFFYFIFEALMLFAFSVSWLVKGETILKDK